MPEPEPDHIRLFLPADADLRKVVEVAVAVVARRLGLSDTEVQAARTATGDAFVELTGAGGGEPVEVDLVLGDRSMVARLRAGGAERRVAVPRATADPSG